MTKPTNTQASEVEAKIDKMLTWDINGHKEPVMFRPEIKAAMVKLIASEKDRLVGELISKLPDPKIYTKAGWQSAEVLNAFGEGRAKAIDQVTQLLLEYREAKNGQ